MAIPGTLQSSPPSHVNAVSVFTMTCFSWLPVLTEESRESRRHSRDERAPKENGLQHRCCNPYRYLAEWTGLEPATPGVTGRYSNQLNYHSAWSASSSLRSKWCRNLRQPWLATPRGFEPLLQP
jgi:hypothetical protein